MLQYVKKYGVIAIIAILFAFFSFSIVDLIVENPDYDDYCNNNKEIPLRHMDMTEIECDELEVPDEAYDSCRGYIEYKYDSKGCPVSYSCNECHVNLDEAREKHNMVGFIVTGILGVLAIIVGMYINSKEDVVDWVLSGLIIGGILSIFIGTARYFGDMSRFLRPIVLFLEMALIIWIAIKTRKK